MDTHRLHPQDFEQGQIIMVMPFRWASCCSRPHSFSSSIWIQVWWDNGNIIGCRISTCLIVSMRSIYCQCHFIAMHNLVSMRSIYCRCHLTVMHSLISMKSIHYQCHFITMHNLVSMWSIYYEGLHNAILSC
jgi:hypothetical protein